MNTVTKIMFTETGHRLIDYPNGRCQHLHGHSYRWEVTATGKIDYRGMVVDFKDLKSAMKEIIDPLDHAVILCTDDPLVQEFGEDGVTQLLVSTAGNPPRLFLVPFNPTAENLIPWVYQQIKEKFPTLIISKIRLWETASSYAEKEWTS